MRGAITALSDSRSGGGGNLGQTTLAAGGIYSEGQLVGLFGWQDNSNKFLPISV